jgi:HSP20 family protein
MNGFGRQGWQDPWQRLRDMEQQMNWLLGDRAGSNGASFPPVNIYTDKDGAIVTAELSGVDPQDLDISVRGRALVLRGERKVPEDGDNERWLRQERVFGQFARTIDLNFAVDQDRVEAKYRDGVLSIRLQRAEADKPKQIAVTS